MRNLFNNKNLSCSPGSREAQFIELCSRQLELAIQESTSEFDAITAAAISSDEKAPGEVIERLQTVDRFVQRLSNVKENLADLARYLTANKEGNRPQTWPCFLEDARASFTTEQEREMFDSVFNGQKQLSSSRNDNLTLFDEEVQNG